MRHTLRFCCFALIVSLICVDESSAALRSRRVATGLEAPLFAAAAPGDSSRLFVMERNGVIKIFDRNSETVLDTPFIDITAKVSTFQAGGLLGMAFHPDYATNGQFYTYYVNLANNSQVSRFVVSGDPNISLDTTGTYVMDWDRERATHTGGWIGFSPVDDYLYILSGDGGGHNDPFNNAQDTSNLLGSVIRVDVDGNDFPGDMFNNYSVPADNPFVGDGGVAPETWAYGLRNPWRGSFDSATGDLIFGDVGQDVREEINFQHASASGGANYGWPLREGTIATPTGGVGGPPPAGNVEPAYDYEHGDATFQGNSVTGGYVYRGPDAAMQGKYFFADYVNGTLWSMEIDRNTGTFVDGTLKDWTGLLSPDEGAYQLSVSMAEDADGNLYVIGITGDMFMLEAIPEVAATGAYLRALYFDVLGRPAEDSGLGYWGSEIIAGNVTPGEVAETFLVAPENLNNLIDGFYDTYLGRDADAAGMTYWSTHIATTDEAEVVASFVTSPEFTASHASDASFVDALYELVLGRTADADGRAFYVGELAAGLTREELAQQFAQSAERYRGLVESFYEDFLGRDGDEAGTAFYVSELVNDSMTLRELALQFLTSDEYVYASHDAIGDIDEYIAGLPFGGGGSTAVPEPSTAVLTLVGAGVLSLRRRRR